MQEQPTTTAIVEIAPITEAITKKVPILAGVRDRAVARMRQLTVIETDEDAAEVNDVLVAAKQAYEYLNKERSQITSPLDGLKKQLMQFENEVAADDDRLRKLLGGYNQAKINKKKEEEDKARQIREKEDYKVELTTLIKRSLADMVMGCAVQVEEFSKKTFDAATVETIDAVAEKYNQIQPGLKPELYEKCFSITHTSKITPKEFQELIAKIKTDEPYEKYKQIAIDYVVPIINDWRAKIPSIKTSKQALAELDANTRAEALKAEQQKSEQESQQRKNELLTKQNEIQTNITQEAQVNMLSNSFVEQGTVQSLDATGPTKKVVLLPEDPLQVPKALAQVMYHCFMHPDFSVYKRDRKKAIVIDENGNQQYADQVQWWLDFYAKNCDAVVEGLRFKDVAKVIVRS